MSPALEIFIKLMLAIVFFGLLAFIFYLLGRSQKKAVRQAAEHARVKGLHVTEGIIPYWESYWAKKAPRSSNKCTEYSIKHTLQKSSRWAFLQREEKSGNEFPYGWTLIVEEGQAPDRLRAALMKIATEWTEEYLEFVSTPEKVSAYCLCGGAELADRLYGYLHELSAVTD